MPRVQDPVSERRGYPWFASYFLAVLLAAAFALSGDGRDLRLCSAMVTLATLGLVLEYWRAWRGEYACSRPLLTPAAKAHFGIPR